MGDIGLEPPPKTSGKTAVSEGGGAESGAVGARNRGVDGELAAVVTAWADLPDAVRVGILAMVHASTGNES